MSEKEIPQHLRDLNQTELEFYMKFRDAHEAYASCAWELECLSVKARQASGEEALRFTEAQKEVDRKLGKCLEVIRSLNESSSATLGAQKKFGKDAIGAEGLAAVVQKRLQRDVLASLEHSPAILKMALLDTFLERERTSRSSIYKKRFRAGFRSTSDSLIKDEQAKNEAWREEQFRFHHSSLSGEDAAMLRLAFKLHMARHGNEQEAVKG